MYLSQIIPHEPIGQFIFHGCWGIICETWYIKVFNSFSRSPSERYSGERIPRNSPVPPQKDTLVRKFPLSPHKGYSGEINLSLPDFFYAEPGGPPLREYKQPMAMYETSPHPGSIKKKIKY